MVASLKRAGGIFWFWLFAGFALLLVTFWQALLARQLQPSPSLFVISQGLTGIIYLAAVYFVWKRPETLPFGLMLLVALALRLILLPSSPLFDDDIHRYLWDGKVLSSGINPFIYPPSAPELAFLRDANWEKIGYPEIRTIYPPLAQIFFALAYAIGLKTIIGLKGLFLLFDLGSLGLIAALLGRIRRPKSWSLIYAWSPLATKEFANSGHLEPMLLFFLLLACHFLLGKNPRRPLAGLSLGAALSTKLMPVLLLPLFWRPGRWKTIAVAVAAMVALYLPFLGAGKLLFSGAGAYAKNWLFNPGIFALLQGLENILFPEGGSLPISFARLLAALLVAAFTIYTALRLDPDKKSKIFVGLRNVLAVSLLLAPVVDPWYVAWLLPFLCFAPSAGLLIFTLSCNLSYLYYANHTFPVWISLIEYIPVYLILLAELLKSKRSAISRRLSESLN